MITRFLIAAPAAVLAATAFIGAAVPAYAAAATQATCDATPGQLRAAATTAPAAAQTRAAILIATGERLCADRARDEAAKKFAAAAAHHRRRPCHPRHRAGLGPVTLSVLPRTGRVPARRARPFLCQGQRRHRHRDQPSGILLVKPLASRRAIAETGAP